MRKIKNPQMRHYEVMNSATILWSISVLEVPSRQSLTAGSRIIPQLFNETFYDIQLLIYPRFRHWDSIKTASNDASLDDKDHNIFAKMHKMKPTLREKSNK